MEFLGSGGQGEVYRADIAGQPVALKWYHDAQATPDQMTAVKHLIHMGAPDHRFAWPVDFASITGRSSYGYTMRLRPHNYCNIVDLMKRRVSPTFRSLLTTCYQLADSFKQLHAHGLCYRDISFGNVFFEPSTGDILICDNDNVVIDGTKSGGVLGTPRFMAPEVVRGEAIPSRSTDLYSLAVLMFYLLMIHHPLEGKLESKIRCFDIHAMNQLYGIDPVFIYDPMNDTNRPVSSIHDNAIAFWPLYPAFIRDLFIRAFTDGIRDSVNGRVTEGEWKRAMVRARDTIIYCTHCGKQNLYQLPESGYISKQVDRCWSCNKILSPSMMIKMDADIVMLNHDTKLYPHHTNLISSFDFNSPTAEVSQHPENPSMWGLRNTSKVNWTVHRPDGGIVVVTNGQNILLEIGTHIDFGNRSGIICLTKALRK